NIICEIVPHFFLSWFAMASIPKAPEGQFNVLYFASASSYTAREYESLPAPLPLNKLFGTLEDKYRGFKDKVLTSCLVTINFDYADIPAEGDGCSVMIKAGDEVAIIPPVSSG